MPLGVPNEDYIATLQRYNAGKDPNVVLSQVLDEYPGLTKVHNPSITTAMFASPERLQAAIKNAQTYSTTGDPGFLEYWPSDEEGPEGFPHPTGGGKNVLEIYKDELRDIEVLKPMIFGDLLHGMVKDPTFAKMRDEFANNFSPEAKRLMETRKGQDDFYSPDSSIDAFIRGAIVPYKGGNWIQQQPYLYTPKQLEILNRMKNYLRTGE
jgi:hypothetical protein